MEDKFPYKIDFVTNLMKSTKRSTPQVLNNNDFLVKYATRLMDCFDHNWDKYSPSKHWMTLQLNEKQDWSLLLKTQYFPIFPNVSFSPTFWSTDSTMSTVICFSFFSSILIQPYRMIHLERTLKIYAKIYFLKRNSVETMNVNWIEFVENSFDKIDIYFHYPSTIEEHFEHEYTNVLDHQYWNKYSLN